ncbi:DUF2599 domain-containing protein [Nocardia inohanensis]|uniref:DUF2599 domain-containing protein n=1 Tax=Nocardia inohanensis TaxID=209246 RepID=UPI00083427F7|nr:DUF2599 domain-containing protein [Nocardia inohanensis]
MRRRWRPAGALIALALGLTGCGAAEESAPVVVGSVTAAAQTPGASSASTAHPIASPSTSPTPMVDVYAGVALIDHTEWTEAVDGSRLLVYPTQAGRADVYPTAGERAWQEVLSQSPEADTPGMRDQFICHWEWARVVQPNKTSWNLEPWRPAVGYQATVNALCNPGGPER